MWLSIVIAALLVAPDIHVIPGGFGPRSQPDGNTVIISAPRGLIVIDTGRHPEHTNAILDFARLSKQPIAAIINTHWHLDHISGNAAIRKAYPDAHVYASAAFEDAKKGFLANYRKQLIEYKPADWEAEVARIDSGDALAPTDIIGKSQTLDIAGRKLQIGLESHAATAGDVWVFDPKTAVLASGDLITVPAPFLDTACPSGWSTSLDHLAAIKFKTVVPGHGAPMTRDDFNMYRTAFTNLLTCAKTSANCIDGWMADAGSLAKNDDPKFVRGVMDYYVNQVLRGDPSRIAKLCAE